jgi:hypothetical protein
VQIPQLKETLKTKYAHLPQPNFVDGLSRAGQPSWEDVAIAKVKTQAERGVQWRQWPAPQTIAAFYSEAAREAVPVRGQSCRDRTRECTDILEAYVDDVSTTLAYQRFAAAVLLAGPQWRCTFLHGSQAAMPWLWLPSIFPRDVRYDVVRRARAEHCQFLQKQAPRAGVVCSQGAGGACLLQ